MGHVGSLRKTLIFFSLGITAILGFSELSVYSKVVLLKTFPQHFELCLYTANIEDVMKFYDLGHKAIETDFKYTFEI